MNGLKLGQAVRNLARELGLRGITINTVQPGPVETDLNPASGEFAGAVRSLTAVGYGRKSSRNPPAR
jgi:NAD(P)-dependent dehydrogenase (short-subunit alcohol dehydrogenase family)